jgi:hypothetical protein
MRSQLRRRLSSCRRELEGKRGLQGQGTVYRGIIDGDAARYFNPLAQSRGLPAVSGPAES